MSQLPTAFPFDAIQTLTGYLRGQAPDLADAANAAYELLGFGLHLWMHGGSQPQQQAFGASAGGDANQQAQQLEQFAQQMQGQQGQQAGAAPGQQAPQQGQQSPPPKAGAGFQLPPWLLPLALQILQQILSRQQPAQAQQPGQQP